MGVVEVLASIQPRQAHEPAQHEVPPVVVERRRRQESDDERRVREDDDRCERAARLDERVPPEGRVAVEDAHERPEARDDDGEEEREDDDEPKRRRAVRQAIKGLGDLGKVPREAPALAIVEVLRVLERRQLAQRPARVERDLGLGAPRARELPEGLAPLRVARVLEADAHEVVPDARILVVAVVDGREPHLAEAEPEPRRREAQLRVDDVVSERDEAREQLELERVVARGRVVHRHVLPVLLLRPTARAVAGGRLSNDGRRRRHRRVLHADGDDARREHDL